jgi:outer membrane protein OmpA-like peptidoglycan-associated protein
VENYVTILSRVAVRPRPGSREEIVMSMRKLYVGLAVLPVLAASPVAIIAAPSPLAAQEVASSYTIEFALGSARLDSAAQATVQQAASAFLRGESPRMELTGHADTTGSPDFNLRLSRQRVENVQEALIDQGVPRDAIAMEAVGSSDLIVPTPDGVAEQANRVVVANLIAPPAPEPAPMPAPQPQEEEEGLLSRINFQVGPFYAFDTESDGHWVGANVTGDFFITESISVGGEQAGFYTFGHTSGYDNGVGGRSVASVDYHLGPWVPVAVDPYIGVNAGGVYGKGLKDSFIYGPELGLTLWGVDARVAYDIRDSGLDESIISATLGWEFSF